MSPLVPVGLQFGMDSDSLEITYLESRNQKHLVQKMEILQITMTPYADRLADLREMVCDIIDQALVDLRDDADDRFSPSRIRDRVAQMEGDQ